MYLDCQQVKLIGKSKNSSFVNLIYKRVTPPLSPNFFQKYFLDWPSCPCLFRWERNTKKSLLTICLYFCNSWQYVPVLHISSNRGVDLSGLEASWLWRLEAHLPLVPGEHTHIVKHLNYNSRHTHCTHIVHTYRWQHCCCVNSNWRTNRQLFPTWTYSSSFLRCSAMNSTAWDWKSLMRIYLMSK